MSTGRPEAALHPSLRWLARSWWVVPAFALGFFTWISFYIVGVRARRRDWVFTGAAYSVCSALLWFASAREEIDNNDTASTLTGLGLVLAWFGGIVHALVINQIYQRELDRGAMRARRRPGTTPAAAPADVGFGLGNPGADYLAAPAPTTNTPLVEANTARTRALRRLPGVTPELAERWVAERSRRGGYADLDDLAATLNLAPHQIVRLRPRLSFAEPGPAKPRRPTRRGRVLDV